MCPPFTKEWHGFSNRILMAMVFLKTIPHWCDFTGKTFSAHPPWHQRLMAPCTAWPLLVPQRWHSGLHPHAFALQLCLNEALSSCPLDKLYSKRSNPSLSIYEGSPASQAKLIIHLLASCLFLCGRTQRVFVFDFVSPPDWKLHLTHLCISSS